MCSTRIWHPNINEDGEVCLSLLRQNSYDSLGKTRLMQFYELRLKITSMKTEDILVYDINLKILVQAIYTQLLMFQYIHLLKSQFKGYNTEQIL